METVPTVPALLILHLGVLTLGLTKIISFVVLFIRVTLLHAGWFMWPDWPFGRAMRNGSPMKTMSWYWHSLSAVYVVDSQPPTLMYAALMLPLYLWDVMLGLEVVVDSLPVGADSDGGGDGVSTVLLLRMVLLLLLLFVPGSFPSLLASSPGLPPPMTCLSGCLNIGSGSFPPGFVDSSIAF